MTKIKSVLAVAAGANTTQLAQNALRETMTIRVDGHNQIIYKDELEKQLHKELYNRFDVGLKSVTWNHWVMHLMGLFILTFL